MQPFQINYIEDWLNTVSQSHSNSKNTTTNYRIAFKKFLHYIGKTAEQIITDYQKTDDRQFKQLYGPYIKSWIGELQKTQYAPRTISGHINVVKSFFKYNDLPLGYLPCGNGLVQFHNRDITREEIAEIIKLADFREKAFYSLMAQTGLRPETLCKLRIGDFEKLLEQNTPIPCLITIRQEATKGAYQGYFTFAPEESIKHLKNYLQKKQTTLTTDSLLFTMADDEIQAAHPGVFSHLFRRVVTKLQKNNVLTFQTKTKKLDIKNKSGKILRTQVSRNELRLYNLRKFFRKYAGQAGQDYVNFWMGHTSALGVDLHYFTRDIEYHRKIFNEKALPFLKIETNLSQDTQKTITELSLQLQQKDTQITSMQQDIQKLQPLMDFINSFKEPEQLQHFLKAFKKADSIKLPPDEGSFIQLDIDETLSNEIEQLSKKSGQKRTQIINQLIEEGRKTLKKQHDIKDN